MSGTAKALAWLAVLIIQLGQYAAAKQLATQSLVLSRRLERPDSIAHALDALAVAALYLGDYGELKVYIKEHHAICQAMGDPFGIALSYNSLGWLAVIIKDVSPTQAMAYSEQAVAMFREIGHRSYLALSLGALAFVASELGEYEKGLPFAREGASLAAEIGNLDFQVNCLCFLGAAEAGDVSWSETSVGGSTNSPCQTDASQ